MKREDFPKHYQVMEALGCFDSGRNLHELPVCNAACPDAPREFEYVFKCDMPKDHEGLHASYEVKWDRIAYIWEDKDAHREG